MRITHTLLLCSALLPLTTQAGWRDELNSAVQAIGLTDDSNNATATGLADTEIVEGLKEALATGTEKAILSLSSIDGYWSNELVKIALPGKIAQFEKPLKKMGMDSMLEEFHLTMNRAAERAVKDVAPIFGNAIRAMGLEDARNILSGADHAATDFFKKAAGQELVAQILPTVAKATEAVGVTRSYKQLIGEGGVLLAAVAPGLADIDQYITDQAVDGLFKTIAEEESKIRNDPQARTTLLLERVFGNKE